VKKTAHHPEGASSATPGTLGVTRRTVTRGLAWTAPVVLTAVTAPAYAASLPPCEQRAGALVASEIGVGHPVVTSVVFGSGTKLVTGTITYATTRFVITTTNGVTTGTDVSPGYGTWGTTEPKEIVTPDLYPGDTAMLDRTRFTDEQSPPGTQNYDYVTLHHPGRFVSTDTYDGTDEGDAIVLTITFPTTVTKLSFALTGIDAEQLQWIDLVSVSPGDFTFAFADVTALQGNGTRLEPFQAIDRSAGLDREDNAGDVRLTWPGAVSEVTVLYRAADEDNLSPTGQWIGVGDFMLGC